MVRHTDSGVLIPHSTEGGITMKIIEDLLTIVRLFYYIATLLNIKIEIFIKRKQRK